MTITTTPALVDALRIDRGTLRSPRETPQGFLRVDGYATRVGVLEYPDPACEGGMRRELRLPEDLFEAASLASYDGASVTDDHPPDLVNAGNVRAYERGTVMAAARRDGEHVAIDMTIKDAALIDKVRRGKAELSSGYAIKLEATSGVHPQYGRYDCIQRQIRVNHVAVVDVGRAGPTARIRTDGALASSGQAATPHTDDHDERTDAIAEIRQLAGARVLALEPLEPRSLAWLVGALGVLRDQRADDLRERERRDARAAMLERHRNGWRSPDERAAIAAAAPATAEEARAQMITRLRSDWQSTGTPADDDNAAPATAGAFLDAAHDRLRVHMVAHQRAAWRRPLPPTEDQ